MSSGARIHDCPTLHYLVGRYQNESRANDVVDWLLKYFQVAGTTRSELMRARGLGWVDFEDAVVTAAAESAGCKYIITRNVRDFGKSPLPALTPEEYLLDIDC